ncbi:MAG TPA: helix-hairpin-helix domain-containing protein, partial [Candidatus Melainabacteria bacterium]|nr:helix-hairpin-helix domain-containing protein [Candidatus Melainabacteria bacterium]
HTSKFDSLPGVGASRRKLLIEEFGTFNKLKEATLEEIEAIKGISAKLAQSIYDFVHEGESPQDEQS